MTPHHPDIHVQVLDQKDPMGRFFLFALGLHLAVVAAAFSYRYVEEHRDRFGDKDAAGGAVGVQVVNSIPLPHTGPTNPVANDTQSQVPQAPVVKPEPRVKKEIIDPDAVRLKDRTKKRLTDIASAQQKFRSFKDVDPNQAFSTQAPQVSSPLYSMQSGSGRIGTGANTTLGNRFAAYASQIQTLISQKWRTNDVDARLQSAPVVIATFDLQRDGRATNIQVLQRSGIPALDYSVQRAITEASPFPPIPSGFDRDSARVEFWFELKR